MKSTLAAIPIYTTICHELPAWQIKSFVKIFKTFLWIGTDVVQDEKCLVTWNRVQWPLQLGGLAVLDLKLMGQALRLPWLWLQRVEPSKPWAALLLHEDAVTRAFFKASIRCTVGDGR
jgi:hypothetical protein